MTDEKKAIMSACYKLDKQKAALTKSINFQAVNPRYQYAVGKFFRIPEDKKLFMINRTAISPWLGVPQVNCRWLYDTSTFQSHSYQTAFSGSLVYRPDYKPSSTQGLIDNKYPVYMQSKYSISVKVG